MVGFRDAKVVHIQGGVERQLNNVLDISAIRTMDSATNTLELTLHNRDGVCFDGGEVIYDRDSIMKLYMAEGEADTSNDEHLIGVYMVSDFNLMPENNTIKLVCADKTFNMLSRIFLGDENARVDQIINTVVQSIHRGEGTGVSIITTDIDSTDSQGNQFPVVQITSTNKTAYEIINELSQVDSTKDNKIYNFWFDENEVFHWKYPTETIIETFNYGSLPVINLTTSRTESTSISTVFYNAGLDKNDSTIWRIYHDPTSTSFRSQTLEIPRVADNLKTLFKRQGVYDSMSNGDFINAVIASAQPKAEAYILAAGKSVWEATIEAYGGKYQIGGYYDIGFGNFDAALKKMRLIKIKHRYNSNGWQSSLSFKEDLKYGSN